MQNIRAKFRAISLCNIGILFKSDLIYNRIYYFVESCLHRPYAISRQGGQRNVK